MVEIWIDVCGYEGFYKVSNRGNIKSLDRICGYMPSGSPRHIKGQKIKPYDNGNGYLMVHLKRDGKRKPIGVHRLVAQTFIPNNDTTFVVNHIDYDKHNNHVNNLEWCSQRDNILHSTIHMVGVKHTKRG